MNKIELENLVKVLEKENNKLINFKCKIYKFLNTNLEPFRNDIADIEDGQNKGIYSVLKALTDIYNAYFIPKIKLKEESNVFYFKYFNKEDNKYD